MGINETQILVRHVESQIIRKMPKCMPVPPSYRVITEIDGFSVFDNRGALLSQYSCIGRVEADEYIGDGSAA